MFSVQWLAIRKLDVRQYELENFNFKKMKNLRPLPNEDL